MTLVRLATLCICTALSCKSKTVVSDVTTLGELGGVSGANCSIQARGSDSYSINRLIGEETETKQWRERIAEPLRALSQKEVSLLTTIRLKFVPTNNPDFYCAENVFNRAPDKRSIPQRRPPQNLGGCYEIVGDSETLSITKVSVYISSDPKTAGDAVLRLASYLLMDVIGKLRFSQTREGEILSFLDTGEPLELRMMKSLLARSFLTEFYSFKSANDVVSPYLEVNRAEVKLDASTDIYKQIYPDRTPSELARENLGAFEDFVAADAFHGVLCGEDKKSHHFAKTYEASREFVTKIVPQFVDPISYLGLEESNVFALADNTSYTQVASDSEMAKMFPNSRPAGAGSATPATRSPDSLFSEAVRDTKGNIVGYKHFRNGSPTTFGDLPEAYRGRVDGKRDLFAEELRARRTPYTPRITPAGLATGLAPLVTVGGHEGEDANKITMILGGAALAYKTPQTAAVATTAVVSYQAGKALGRVSGLHNPDTYTKALGWFGYGAPTPNWAK